MTDAEETEDGIIDEHARDCGTGFLWAFAGAAAVGLAAVAIWWMK